MNDYVFSLEIYNTLDRKANNETVVVSEKNVEEAYAKILKKLKNNNNKITIVNVKKL